MRTKKLFFMGLLGAAAFQLNAQNVQSDQNATSGGMFAGTSAAPGANTFYGYLAGASTDKETPLNTFIGHQAGYLDTTGRLNVFVGAHSGEKGTKVSRNTFVGAYSGFSNEGNGYEEDPGGHNAMFGYAAGMKNTKGNNNTFLGCESGLNNDGTGNIFIGHKAGRDATGGNQLFIDITETKEPLIYGNFKSRQVGIGGFSSFPTTAGGADVTTYTLFVRGGILTEEVRVRLSSTWADYVFSSDYKLPTLAEVEKNIKENGTLINVPSAAKVASDGIELGEMAKIQQEKIEELTLYLIQQNKELELLKAQVKELMAKN